VNPGDYLEEVERGLDGSPAARRRLVTELRGHLEDSLAAAAGEDVMERMGEPADVIEPWRAHTSTVRAQRRRRVALLTLAAASAAALGIAQHASGHRTPQRPCSVSHPAHVAPACARLGARA